jgi:hypothetical protein
MELSIQNKRTSISLTEKTKKMLELLSEGKETHEEILVRIINLINKLSSHSNTKIIRKNKVFGTEYNRKHKTFEVNVTNVKYSFVCIYNDLDVFAAFRSSQILYNVFGEDALPKWELNLEIVNAKSGNSKWEDPREFSNYLLFYFVAIKQVLEIIFDINLYEIANHEDYFNLSKWEETYNRNKLSLDSFNTDVKNKLQQLDFN